MGGLSAFLLFLISCNSFTFYYRLKLSKHKNLWWQGGPSNYQKFCSKERSVISSKQQKSFLRERSVSFLLKSRSEGNAELTVKNKR